MFKNYLIILMILISINSIHCQGIKKVIKNKGTIIEIDESKLSINDTAISNKRDPNKSIGITEPCEIINVAGDVKITGGVPSINKAITMNETGLVTMYTPMNIFNSDDFLLGSRIIGTIRNKFSIRGTILEDGNRKDNQYHSILESSRHSSIYLQKEVTADYFLGSAYKDINRVPRLNIKVLVYPRDFNPWGNIHTLDVLTLPEYGRVLISPIPRTTNLFVKWKFK